MGEEGNGGGEREKGGCFKEKNQNVFAGLWMRVIESLYTPTCIHVYTVTSISSP